ncbi:periaxin-like [Aulostomus maculatus]
MPKVKGPDIDLGITEKKVDLSQPKAKAEVNLPDVELKEHTANVEIKAPEIEGLVIEQHSGVEVDAKLKKPRFSLPRFSISKQGARAPEFDVSRQDQNVVVPVGALEVKGEGVDITQPKGEEEIEGQGKKFKLPKFGTAIPKVTGPEIDVRIPKRDGDVSLPEAKVAVELPDDELKGPSVKVEMKSPEIKVGTKDTEGSPSKFKMPTLKLPNFGGGSLSATAEVPDVDKDVKIDGGDIKFPEEVLAISIAAPSIDTDQPSIDVTTKGSEHERRGSKFKLPSLGFSVPQVKGPEFDLTLSKKDVDENLQKTKAEIQVPDVELKESSAKLEIEGPGIEISSSNAEGSPSKFKMPTFNLPKFGAATPQVSVEVPGIDKDIKVDGTDTKLPEAKIEVKLPDADKEDTGSISGQQAPIPEGNIKLKRPSWAMPRFSISKGSVKTLDTDVSVDVPKVNVTCQETKIDAQLPDMTIKDSSSISVEGAPITDLDAKLKKPRFSLPTFSFSKQSAKAPEVDVGIPDVDSSSMEGNVEVKQPKVETYLPGGDGEIDGQESKLKMPKFGISMPKIKGPEIDLSLSKKDDVKLPETEVQLPDVKMKQLTAKVEIKAPEIETQTSDNDGSPSKFKLPTIKLPKFGTVTQQVNVEVPDMDKDIKLQGADYLNGGGSCNSS